MLLPLLGLLLGVLAGLVLNINVGFELSRYSAVAILAALDSVLGAVRAELDGVYDNRIFISGFLVNAIIAVLLTFIGDRLDLDLYLVALLAFGLRIFDNVALIRRHFRKPAHTGDEPTQWNVKQSSSASMSVRARSAPSSARWRATAD